MDMNGLELIHLVERQGLKILNTDARCLGSITRHRLTKRGVEQAILDYILVCENMFTFFDSMIIDEARHFPLTNYLPNGTRKPSDHNILLASFKLTYNRNKMRSPRREIFNLKNTECRKEFFNQTNICEAFKKITTSECSVQTKCERFFSTLDGKLHKCFKKIRVKQQQSIRPKRTELHKCLLERSRLSATLDNVKCNLAKEITVNCIEELDTTISKMTSRENAARILENIKSLTDTEGKFSLLSMWKLKSRIINCSTEKPTAKKDKNGTLLTTPYLLKELYLNTYIDRLQNRPIRKDLLDIYNLKMELWELYNYELENTPSSDWTESDLDIVLRGLKNNKTRDPHDLINEIFKPSTMGNDMKEALLSLFNQIKRDKIVPEAFKYANISSIYKNKGSQQSLDNDRGIFVVTILRMILDGLIYKEKFPLIDKNMSSSNIGARSKRNIRDHLFIVYGIVNSVVNGTSAPIDLQIYDVQKCFDELWLEDVMLDIVSTLPEQARDEKIALIYKLNEDSLVAVKTPFGLTKRVSIKNVVMQGGKWGPVKCSNSIDQIGKKCLNRRECLYKYNGEVYIPPLAMVDDLLAVAKCGSESLDMNIKINCEIDMKKLRLHTPDINGKSKCHVIHVQKQGKHRPRECLQLSINGYPMEEVEHDRYLGDIISNNGNNIRNIQDRVSKGLGIISHIFDILKNISLGTYYFRIALALREAFLINGILFNSEIWYGLNKTQIEKLMEVDILFLRKLFRVSASCPREALFLESGCLPFDIIIKERRLKYLHNILTREPTDMLYSFFQAQWWNPVRNDWTIQIKEDLEMFEMSANLESIASHKKEKFKAIIKEKARDIAFKRLLRKKELHSKMKNLRYTELKVQEYLVDGKLTVNQALEAFKSRVRMTLYWDNFKGWKLEQTCPVCKDSSQVDTQSHSFNCGVISQNIQIKGEYADLFNSKLSIDLVKTVVNIEKFRKQYVEK